MNPDHQQLWGNCLKIFRDNLSTEQYNSWFEPIIPLSFDGKELWLGVPTNFFVEQLEERYFPLLKRTLCRVYGNGVQLFYKFNVVGSDPGSSMKIASGDQTTALKPVGGNPFMPHPVVDELDSHLNPKNTFNNYCPGNSNKIARSIGEAIASDPNCKTFNPLFLFGPTGVGKTHLVQAIGIGIKERDPKARVLYLSARLFESQYTAAATAKPSRVNEFINFYQSIDVLIIGRHSGFDAQTGHSDRVFPHIQSSVSQPASDNHVERLRSFDDERHA